MRNTALAFFALALLVSPISYAAQEAPATSQESQDQLPEAWKELEPAFKSEWLSTQIARDIEFATKNGPQQLDELAKSLPFTGVGIQHWLETKEQNRAGGVIGFRIHAVYVGSPADKAGIQPGDWILGINDTPACAISYTQEDFGNGAKSQELQRCTEQIENAFSQAQGAITVTVERAGKMHTASLVRTAIGQELAAEVSGKLGNWKQVFANTASELTKLAERVKAAGKDNAKLDECFLELQKQKEALQKPGKEFSEMEKRHIRTLEGPQ